MALLRASLLVGVLVAAPAQVAHLAEHLPGDLARPVHCIPCLGLQAFQALEEHHLTLPMMGFEPLAVVLESPEDPARGCPPPPSSRGPPAAASV